MMNLEKIILDIIRNSVPMNMKKNVWLEADLNQDLGFNSLRLITLTVELEAKANFDVLRASEEISFTEIRKVKDIRDIVLMYQKQ